MNDVNDEKTLTELVDEVWHLKERLGTWQAVGDHYDVSRIIVWRIANNNYEPKNNEARLKLGIDKLVFIRQARGKDGRFQRQHS